MRKCRLEMCGLLVISAMLLGLNHASAADPFADVIRKADPLTPELEVKALHVPEGFEVQLVASEPDINKPVNMAFDAKGRLWITSTKEYPFPVKAPAVPRDQIKVLEDFGADGRAKKITTFAEGLNIPVGLYPFNGGVIVHSIPNVWLLQDTDGDGKADKKDILWGPIGFEKDTHGMTSAFRRGFDGWIYACHGFNNDTSFTAKDGSSIKMNSGNTYRVKIDGSRVEQNTWGQVNPFGLAFDPLGNLYSADCHSSPIYQLLRGAYYPSFGKPNDGLGFAPTMMNHSHGSTAIGGIVYYADEQYPAEYRGNCFVGNVMTCRINRDTLEDHGTTRIAKQATDFLKSDDPWFRPVDIQLGPDGAIYVADFYNRIIGHYEVALTHPGRDRERGRIFRIVYKGAGATEAKVSDLTVASVTDLVAALGHNNLTVRMLATNQLTDRIGKPAVPEVEAAMGKGNAWQKVHGLWVLQRLDALKPEFIAAAAKDESREVRTHVMKVLSETAALTPEQSTLLIAALQDKDAFVQRATADALGRHPAVENLRPLLTLRGKVPGDDTHTLHAVRMAVRDQLKGENGAKILAALPQADWNEQDTQTLAEMALAIPSPDAGSFLLRHLQKSSESREKMSAYLKHAARYIPAGDIDVLVSLIKTKFAGDDEFQLSLFKPLQDGMSQRGAALSEAVRTWAAEMAGKMLGAGGAEPSAWTNTPLEGAATPDPWSVQKRNSADGKNNLPFLSSLPNEAYTGTLRSKPFSVPAKLSFFLAGHNGEPPKNVPPKNFIRLRDAASNEVLMEAVPPRNDIAQKVDWDLAKFAGKNAILELVDGDTGSGYAWLAAGRFEPAVAALPKTDAAELRAARLNGIETANSLKLMQLEPLIAKIPGNSALDSDTRVAAAKALLSLNPAANAANLAKIIVDPKELPTLKEKMAQALADANSAESRTLLAGTLAIVPERMQTKLALSLAGNAEGAEVLMKTITEGKASPRLLQEKKIRERLDAAKLPELEERITKLTKGLTAPDAELQKVINKRRNDFDPATASAAKGLAVFTKNCVLCHSVDGKGALVGPQLDGVGARGAERIIEDVLDPNRNVDPAFRYSVVIANDGRVINGLQRREEGELLVFADNTGKEVTVAKKDIKQRNESKFSLMPDNFAEVIPVADFNDLLAFLLSKAAK